jgi:hypothetical protein
MGLRVLSISTTISDQPQKEGFYNHFEEIFGAER